VSFDSSDVAFDFSAFAGASARCRACALVLKLFSNFLHHPRTLHSTLQCTVTFTCASRSLTRRVFDPPAWELVHCLHAGLAQLSICLRSLHSLAFRSCIPKRLLVLRSSYSIFHVFQLLTCDRALCHACALRFLCRIGLALLLNTCADLRLTRVTFSHLTFRVFH
jgi:hypothetical protein